MDQAPVSKEKSAIAPTPLKGSETHEVFLGNILVVFLVLLLLGATGFFGYLGYRVWRNSQMTASIPSIERLSKEIAVTPQPKEEAPVVVPATPPTDISTTVDKKTLEIKVMNGGAVKGSAGTLTAALVKLGYTKATTGNATGNYTGATIYFAIGKDAEAAVLKADIAKTYPTVTLAPAIAANKETTVAPLVIILGK